ncbi:MAG: HipA domain-containing protein [Pleomorphochaeta sp.]
MNKCLCCGKPLLNNELDWHKSCIKKFFGTTELPIIDTKQFSNIFSDIKSKESVITGVQKKISLHLDKNKNNPRLTIVNYPSGYILKPNSKDYPDMIENEYLTMHLANICNIETVPFGLIKLEDNTRAYITKRIDRIGKKKLAMEDFCQLGEFLTEQKYNSSYEKIGNILNKYSDNIGLDSYKLFNIILFSFIVGNSDMHLKNFSLYEKDDRYILAPSYDLLNTLIIIPEDKEELALTLNGKKNKLKIKDFIYLAQKYNLNKIQIERIFNNFQKKYSILIEAINESLLTKESKTNYINLVNDRYHRLFN